MASQNTLRETVGSIFATELPYNDCLVPGGGQDHIRVFGRGGNGGDPSDVGGEGAFEE